MNKRLGRWALGMGAAAAVSTALVVPNAAPASAATTQAPCGNTEITGSQLQNAIALQAINGDVFVLEVQNQFSNRSVPFGNTDLWQRRAGQASFTRAPIQPTSLAGLNAGNFKTIPAADGIFYAAIIPQTTLAIGDPIAVIYNTCTYDEAVFGTVTFS